MDGMVEFVRAAISMLYNSGSMTNMKIWSTSNRVTLSMFMVWNWLPGLMIKRVIQGFQKEFC